MKQRMELEEDMKKKRESDINRQKLMKLGPSAQNIMRLLSRTLPKALVQAIRVSRPVVVAILMPLVLTATRLLRALAVECSLPIIKNMLTGCVNGVRRVGNPLPGMNMQKSVTIIA